MASIRPGLPSQTMSSTISTCHTWSGGGTALSSSVDITCISKQYWVSGQLGFGLLARDQDGEHDGALPNASGFSWPFWPFVAVRVWPSVWILISGSKSSRSLDLVAIDIKTVAVNWNSRYFSTNWVQKPLQENKDTYGLSVTASYPWWVRDPFICHQWFPLQAWGHFLPGKRCSPALLNHQSGNLRDGQELPQLHTVKPDLWDPATSFSAHPGTPENVTSLRDAKWISVLIRVVIYPMCANSH